MFFISSFSNFKGTIFKTIPGSLFMHYQADSKCLRQKMSRTESSLSQTQPFLLPLEKKGEGKKRQTGNEEDKGEVREMNREQKKVARFSSSIHLVSVTSAFLLQPDGITLPWCHQAITSLSHGNYLSSAALWLADSQHCHMWPLVAQPATDGGVGGRERVNKGWKNEREGDSRSLRWNKRRKTGAQGSHLLPPC